MTPLATSTGQRIQDSARLSVSMWLLHGSFRVWRIRSRHERGRGREACERERGQRDADDRRVERKCRTHDHRAQKAQPLLQGGALTTVQERAERVKACD